VRELKRLTERQITRCETSRKPRCKCRCQGHLHGIAREGFTQLPMLPIPQAQQHRPIQAESTEAEVPPADFDWSSTRDPW